MKPTPISKPFPNQSMESYFKDNINKMVDAMNYGIEDPKGDGKTIKVNNKVISAIGSGGSSPGESATIENNDGPFFIERKDDTKIQIYNSATGNYQTSLQTAGIASLGAKYCTFNKAEITVTQSANIIVKATWIPADGVFAAGEFLLVTGIPEDTETTWHEQIGAVEFENSKIKSVTPLVNNNLKIEGRIS